MTSRLLLCGCRQKTTGLLTLYLALILIKLLILFPQFKVVASVHPSRVRGKTMSVLRAKLQTFFGMDSLPTLGIPTGSANLPSNGSLPATVSIPCSPSNLKRSLNSLPQQQRKRQRKLPGHMSLISEVITSTMATLPSSSTNPPRRGSEIWEQTQA